ncbi:MAG: hypothetical protein ACK55Z_36350, partial [bacterium]
AAKRRYGADGEESVIGQRAQQRSGRDQHGCWCQWARHGGAGGAGGSAPRAERDPEGNFARASKGGGSQVG